MTDLRVAVLGPGGVGGLIAATLARDGIAITCVATEDTARWITDHGIEVRSERFGSFRIAVAANARLLEPADVLVVATKATSLQPSLERLGAPSALVVPLLNGLDHVAMLRDALPGSLVVPSTIRIESTRVSPGVIVHDSAFARIDLAPPDGAEAATAAFAEDLRTAGFDVMIRDDEKATLWDKLAFLAPLALLTTRHRATAQDLRTTYRPELQALAEEISAVATADGAPIEAAQITAQFDAMHPTLRSSMARDDEAHRPMEVDAIGGAILRAAARARLAVPTLATIVSELEERAGRYEHGA